MFFNKAKCFHINCYCRKNLQEVRNMDRTLLILNSITYAMKGRDILRAKKIKAEIKRVSKRETLHGCGYGLLIYGNAERAKEILRDTHIKVMNQIEMEEKQ